MSSTDTTTGYVIRTRTRVIGTYPTLGDTLTAANTIGDQKATAVFWGQPDAQNSMSLATWRLWANSTLARLTSRGLPTAALLANDGTR